jgi:hypothetical protein
LRRDVRRIGGLAGGDAAMNEEAVEMGFDNQIIMRDMQSAVIARAALP